ncbi:MAG TPA: prenyltransferase [Anaerolineales bacterium]|nr:prenyltransferase [Anaerolineales bacterium]
MNETQLGAIEDEKLSANSIVSTWITALQRPIKLYRKSEWDKLDIITQWLIATRGTVTQLTAFSGVIAGLLAWRDGYFSWLPWLVMTVGLYFAHSTENLVNDYIDYSRGVDEDNYYRAQYGIHPLVHKFWTRQDWLRWFLTAGMIATLAGVFMLIYTSFSLIVLVLFAIGILMIPFYAYPLKYLGLGEVLIYINWGLIIIPGVYTVLAGGITPNLGYVALAGLSFGLGFGSFNWGKHVDKLFADKAKGVRTLPVRIGERASRLVNTVALLLSYALILYLVFMARFLTPAVLLVFLAWPRAWRVIRLLQKPRPTEPPPGFEFWPRWFSTPQLRHVRLFGGLYIIGLLLDNLLRVFAPGFWM